MKVDLFNIESFIKENKCPQVSNSVFFQFDKNPTPDGLFSYELFGVTDAERRNIFGYADLHGYYIHPLIYSMMVGRMGSIRDILAGNKYAIILKNKIQIVPEDYDGAETGLDFLYRHYDEINWIDEVEEAEIDSIDKKTRLNFLKSLKKDEFFITKWLIIPPFYRSESTEDMTMGDEINKAYKNLISRTNSMKSGFGIKLFGDQTKLRIQNTLLEIFMLSTSPIKGKKSLLRKGLLGKTIDYSASNVITAPEISKANRPKDMPVNFGYSSFPLPTVISLFIPFYSAEITRFLSELLKFVELRYGNDIETINRAQYNTQYADKLIKLFIKSETERFNPITFEYTDIVGEKVSQTIQVYEYRSKADMAANKYIMRDLTLADLFYIITMESIVPDKHVYVTRYPVINFQNIYPAKIRLMSTAKTREAYIKMDPELTQVLHYDEYPYIKFADDPNPGNSTDYNFTNVMIPGNVYIKAMGGRRTCRII